MMKLLIILVLLLASSISLAFDVSIYDNRRNYKEVYIELVCVNGKKFYLDNIKKKDLNNSIVIKTAKAWLDYRVYFECKE